MGSKFTFIDLFSGIGGFHIGMSKSGGKCLMASDIDEQANETYFKNFRQIPVGDIRKVQNKNIPNHDVLCGGFPCQAFSNVGQKGGLDDSRGAIIYEVFRILRGKKPKAFVLENVKGILNHNGGLTYKIIEEELSKSGYKVYSKILEAKDYGLPQIRKRLFIVGVKKNIKVPFVFPPEAKKLKYSLAKVMNGDVEREFAFTIRIGGRRSGINNRFNWDAYRVNGEVRYITPDECKLLQGFPKRFKLTGSQSKQYKQVGNSVPVTIVEAIGKQLVKLGIV